MTTEKKEAIAFADWIVKNGYIHLEHESYGKTWASTDTYEGHTSTTDLYNKFLSERKEETKTK